MPAPQGYARHFAASNRHDLSHFVPFFIGGKRYGWINKDLVALLLNDDDNAFVAQDNGLALAERFTSFAERSEALRLATQKIATHFGKSLRHEQYAVIENWGDAPVAQIDRIAVPWFGVRAWGVHVNGFVRKPNGIYLWIGKRADDRPADPGKLDNLIGGGQPIGLTIEQNLCKEAMEEAGIEAKLALTAKQMPTINYRLERSGGLRSDSLFVFDLELPEEFIPRNTDGEVAAFYLKPLAEVAALVRDTDQFKFNCNLVITSFLLRHGFITQQDTAEYDELTRWIKV